MISKFFQPDDTMTKFIIGLAKNKTIVDMGAGTGHVLAQIKKNGYNNFIGFEPFTPFESQELSVAHRMIPRQVMDDFTYKMMYAIRDKSMMILCRPCHHPELVLGSISMCKQLGMELFYIGLKRNIHMDLDIHGIKYDIIPHTGTSKENEIILKLN